MYFSTRSIHFWRRAALSIVIQTSHRWSFVLGCMTILIFANPLNTDLRGATLQDLNVTPTVMTGDSIPFDSIAYNQIWSNLNPSIVTTSVLHDKQLTSYVNFDKFTGDSTNYDTGETSTWRQIYHEMYNSFMGSPTIPSLSHLDSIAKPLIADRKVPIALLYMKYNAIKDNAIEDGLLSFQNKQLVVNQNKSESPCLGKEVFTAAPLVDNWVGGLTVPFCLDANFFQGIPVNIIGGPGTEFWNISVYFGNDQPPRTITQSDIGQTISVTYPSYGKKVVLIIAEHHQGGIAGNNDVYFASFVFWITEHVFPNKDIVINGPGYQAIGLYGAGNTSGKFKKPIIIVEGFDPGNTNNFEEIYFRLNQQFMAERVRALGYDVIIMNFADGTGAIQTNAGSLKHLITYVNQNRTPGTNEKNVVVGASMGGLIARYALMDMENNGPPHNARLFISFDSPQQGANIPIGVQWGIDFFANSPGSVQSAADARAILRTDAAKQMLSYHFDPSGIAAHAQFFENLTEMGDYPHATGLRKVAIANGSGNGFWQWGNTNRMGPQSHMIHVYKDEGGGKNAHADFYSMPAQNAGSQLIFAGYKDFYGYCVSSSEVRISGALPLDHVCGGWRNTMGAMAGGGIYVYYPNHAFIPTTSALDLRETNGDPVSPDRVVLGSSYTTPFDDVFCESSDNNEHVTVTPAIAQYVINQLNNLQDNWLLQNITVADEESAYRARYTIIAAGPDGSNYPTIFNVTSTGNVTLEAGSQIVLKPGFHAAIGSKVIATIKDFSASVPFNLVNLAGRYQSYSGGIDVPTKTTNPDAQRIKSSTDNSFLPDKTKLQNNYPNPFTASTTIRYGLKTGARVKIDVYNGLGQKVRALIDAPQATGYHTVNWNGRNDRGTAVAKGVYLCRFIAGDYAKSIKMIFVK